MTNELKPEFFLTKAERETISQVDDLERPLIEVWKGLYEWKGLPDGLESDTVQEWIWYNGRIGAMHLEPFGDMLYPARQLSLNQYGKIDTWKPITLFPSNANIQKIISGEFDTPVLDMFPLHELIAPYIDTMTHAWITLRTNIVAMRTPVLLTGQIGSEVSSLIFGGDVKSGEVIIPTINNSLIECKALDLGAADHSVNMMGAYNEALKICLSHMGIGGAFGSSKQSGLSTVEVIASDNPTNIIAWKNLKKMEQFCKAANEALGMNLSVSLGEGYQPTVSETEAKEDKDEPDPTDVIE